MTNFGGYDTVERPISLKGGAEMFLFFCFQLLINRDEIIKKFLRYDNN